jgi:hypothetical protein
MKKIIKLNESKLKYIISKTIKTIIKENINRDDYSTFYEDGFRITSIEEVKLNGFIIELTRPEPEWQRKSYFFRALDNAFEEDENGDIIGVKSDPSLFKLVGDSYLENNDKSFLVKHLVKWISKKDNIKII